MERASRTPYPSDVTDDAWAFVSPYLVLMDEAAPQRTHDLRDVCNDLRWIVRTDAPGRMRPHDRPPLGRRVSTNPPLDPRRGR